MAASGMSTGGRTYKRDQKGRFSSTGGGAGAGGKKGLPGTARGRVAAKEAGGGGGGGAVKGKGLGKGKKAPTEPVTIRDAGPKQKGFAIPPPPKGRGEYLRPGAGVGSTSGQPPVGRTRADLAKQVADMKAGQIAAGKTPASYRRSPSKKPRVGRTREDIAKQMADMKAGKAAAMKADAIRDAKAGYMDAAGAAAGKKAMGKHQTSYARNGKKAAAGDVKAAGKAADSADALAGHYDKMAAYNQSIGRKGQAAKDAAKAKSLREDAASLRAKAGGGAGKAPAPKGPGAGKGKAPAPAPKAPGAGKPGPNAIRSTDGPDQQSMKLRKALGDDTITYSHSAIPGRSLERDEIYAMEFGGSRTSLATVYREKDGSASISLSDEGRKRLAGKEAELGLEITEDRWGGYKAKPTGGTKVSSLDENAARSARVQAGRKLPADAGGDAKRPNEKAGDLTSRDTAAKIAGSGKGKATSGGAAGGKTSAGSKPKSKGSDDTKRLDELGKEDLQGRGGRYPASGKPTSGQVTRSGGQTDVGLDYKNTSQAAAERDALNRVKSRLPDRGKGYDISVSSSQAGDYDNDWVEVSVTVKPKGGSKGSAPKGAGEGPSVKKAASASPKGAGEGPTRSSSDRIKARRQAKETARMKETVAKSSADIKKYDAEYDAQTARARAARKEAKYAKGERRQKLLSDAVTADGRAEEARLNASRAWQNKGSAEASLTPTSKADLDRAAARKASAAKSRAAAIRREGGDKVAAARSYRESKERVVASTKPGTPERAAAERRLAQAKQREAAVSSTKAKAPGKATRDKGPVGAGAPPKGASGAETPLTSSERQVYRTWMRNNKTQSTTTLSKVAKTSNNKVKKQAAIDTLRERDQMDMAKLKEGRKGPAAAMARTKPIAGATRNNGLATGVRRTPRAAAASNATKAKAPGKATKAKATKRSFEASAIKPGDKIGGQVVADVARQSLGGGFHIRLENGKRVKVRRLSDRVKIDN